MQIFLEIPLTNRQKSGIIVYENKADTLCLTV